MYEYFDYITNKKYLFFRRHKKSCRSSLFKGFMWFIFS